MTTRDDEVCPELVEAHLLGAERLHGVDTEKEPLGRVTLTPIREADAIFLMGSFTPVPECTQVTATTRVSGRTPSTRRLTISSSDACAGSS